jgi:hypothetical protein
MQIDIPLPPENSTLYERPSNINDFVDAAFIDHVWLSVLIVAMKKHIVPATPLLFNPSQFTSFMQSKFDHVD